MNLVPLGDRVVIKQSPKATQTKAGIILPETVGEDHTEGTILALGPDVRDEETLKEGDKVLFTKYAGSEIKIDGETFVIIRQKDIMAIYREPAAAQAAETAHARG